MSTRSVASRREGQFVCRTPQIRKHNRSKHKLNTRTCRVLHFLCSGDLCDSADAWGEGDAPSNQDSRPRNRCVPCAIPGGPVSELAPMCTHCVALNVHNDSTANRAIGHKAAGPTPKNCAGSSASAEAATARSTSQSLPLRRRCLPARFPAKGRAGAGLRDRSRQGRGAHRAPAFETRAVAACLVASSGLASATYTPVASSGRRSGPRPPNPSGFRVGPVVTAARARDHRVQANRCSILWRAAAGQGRTGQEQGLFLDQ